MEDLIYIILAIIWIVVGIIGNRKKKKAPQSSQPKGQTQTQSQSEKPEPAPKSEVDAILEEFLGETETTAEGAKHTHNQAKAEYEPYESREDYKFWHEKSEEDAAKTYEQYTEGFNIEDDYQFSAQKALTIDEMIGSLEKRDSNRIELTSLDEEDDIGDIDEQSEFIRELVINPKKAVLYSEIIKKRF